MKSYIGLYLYLLPFTPETGQCFFLFSVLCSSPIVCAGSGRDDVSRLRSWRHDDVSLLQWSLYLASPCQ